MIQAIKDFFNNRIDDSAQPAGPHTVQQLHLATAALLIEVARADHEITKDEMERISTVITNHLQLNKSDSKQLTSLAEDEVKRMTSYFEFSSLINKGFSYKEKVKLIELMWEIALADNRIDKYESHLIRKIAHLIYVKREDIVYAKHQAEQSFS